jgi:hypothetical protein
VKNWLKAANGSWKTAWTWRQYSVRARPLRWVTSLPWKTSRPEVIGIRPSSIRAIVDLPEPLSPTIVVTLPCSRSKETSRTAWTPFFFGPKVLVMCSAV